VPRRPGSFGRDRPQATRRRSASKTPLDARHPGADQAPPPTDARDAACRALESQVRRFPDLAILEPPTAGLAPRDAALAHAIYACAIRRWLTLRWLVTRHTRGPFARLHPPIRAALLCGAAQIAFLDRVPTHAAVSTSVAWTKRRAGSRAGGLVNAVLRKVAADVHDNGTLTRADALSDPTREIPRDDGSALAVAPAALPEPALDRLSITTSLPVGVLRRWTEHDGQKQATRLAVRSLALAPIILNVEHAEDPLPESVTPHEAEGHAVLDARRDAVGDLIESRRDLWVQDPGSAESVRAIADLEPACVADLCAGLGTKTRQLAATFPRARILATDRDTHRLEVLARVFASDERVEVMQLDELRERALTSVDVVVLDVPCSNSGVLSRRLEARYRISAGFLEELASMQRQLIADAIPLLKPDGRILYATCSLEPEENEAQAAWAARWHGFAPTRERRRLPSGGPGCPRSAYADAGYSVVLEPGPAPPIDL